MVYLEGLVGFYCDPKYQYDSSGCADVSLNAYTDNHCGSGDYYEIRLITDECIYSDWHKWQQLECTEDTATMYYYDTIPPQCSDAYMTNSTLLHEGSLDGGEAGCMTVEGCDTEAPSKSPTIAQSQSPFMTTTNKPTSEPTGIPSIDPTRNPLVMATRYPTDSPAKVPTTPDPTTSTPVQLTTDPTLAPTLAPSRAPTTAYSMHSLAPTLAPSERPSVTPSVSQAASKSETNDSKTSSVVIYIIIGVVIVVIFCILIIFAQRYYYKKKLDNIAFVNASINEETAITSVTSQRHSGKMQLISTNEWDEPAITNNDGNVDRDGGDDKTSGLLASQDQMDGNQ